MATFEKSLLTLFFPCGEPSSVREKLARTNLSYYFVLKAEIPCDPLGEHSISAFLTCTLSYNEHNATRYTKGRFLISTTSNTNHAFLFSFFLYFGIVDIFHINICIKISVRTSSKFTFDDIVLLSIFSITLFFFFFRFQI